MGAFTDAGGTHGFLDNDNGFTSIDVDFPGAANTIAYGIDNSGHIVGSFEDPNGTPHGFLATPVPEPSTLFLVGSGLIAIFKTSRRKSKLASGTSTTA